MSGGGSIEAMALLAGLQRIFLRNFAIACSIGIHESERARPQRILLNIDLYVEPDGGTEGDDIRRVVDYDFLRDEIFRLVAGRHFNLQETLAREIGAICLARPGVLGARIATEKPDIYPDCEAVGLEMLVATDRLRALLR